MFCNAAPGIPTPSAISFAETKTILSEKGVIPLTISRFLLDSRCAINALFIRFNNQPEGFRQCLAELSVRNARLTVPGRTGTTTGTMHGNAGAIEYRVATLDLGDCP